MQFRRGVLQAVVLVLAGIAPVAAAGAQNGECQAPNESDANGHVAGTLGGGLFGGLVLAVLQLKHHRELGALQPGAVPIASAPAGAAPMVTVSAGSIADPLASPAAPAGGGATQAAPGQLAEAPMPPLTAREARREGLVPPKTATIFPALAMIGAGSFLLGLFFLRERSGRRRAR